MATDEELDRIARVLESVIERQRTLFRLADDLDAPTAQMNEERRWLREIPD